MYWVALLSGILNALFMADFCTVAFLGHSLTSLLFGTGLAESVTSYVPGMRPWEFLVANAVILAFVSVVMLLSIYVAFYSDRRQCYIGDDGE